MGYQDFLYEVRDAIAWVTINREKKLNTMTPRFYPELRSILAEAGANPDVRVIVIRGAGDRAFCAGGDIESFGDLTNVAECRTYIADCFSMFQALETVSKPTIAAVCGYALGGGMELSLACDIVIADETARFGTPEAKVGLMPGFGVVRGTSHLSLHAMKYFAFTGETVDAQEAKSLGLVNRLVPKGQLEAEVLRVAGLIAANAPLGVKVAKAIINRGIEDGYTYTVEATSLLHATDDQHEGVAAFKERRKPNFQGR